MLIIPNHLQAFNKEECMNLLDEGTVHLTTLDAGEVFIGGRYHSLIPLMQEKLESNLPNIFIYISVKFYLF
jgi:melanoma-associated antigen p97